jgi:glycosyltransferase involved in cell wall biosynthesis
MINPKFSIIIPCYNSQKTIANSIDSVISQNYTNFDIIVVNDGSIDNTKDIILSYCDRFPNVTLISKGNSGVSTARNRGLDAATGDYIFFMDSDDALDPYMLKKIAKTIERNDCDLVLFGHKIVSKEGKIIKKNPIKTDVKNPLLSFLDGKISINIWSLVAKKECYFSDSIIRFNPNIYLYEDLEVIVQLLNNSKKIFYLKDLLYSYLENSSYLLSEKEYTEKKFSSILAWSNIFSYVKENDFSSKILNSTYNRLVYSYIKQRKLYLDGDYFTDSLDQLFEKYEYLIKKYPPFHFTKFFVRNVVNILLYKTSNDKF